MQTLEREIETLNPPEIEQSIAPSQWMQYGRAFAGLFLRDLHVLRREWKPFIVRVIIFGHFSFLGIIS